MIDYVKSFEFTSTLAMLIYWLPMAICLGVYLFKIIGMYRADLGARDDDAKFYRPTLTIGAIVWRLVLSVTPAVNLFALVFDCMADVFKWLGSFLDIPLVSKRSQP
jgi:hypothetical protein